MTKTKAVMIHLEEQGSITSWEAIKNYGITRLGVIIHQLRHRHNMKIENEWIDFKDRFGNKARYVRYIYKKEK